MTFKPSSYLSTSGDYGDKDDERYGGDSSMNAPKDDDGKELESRSQRESNRLCRVYLQLRALENVHCIELLLSSSTRDSFQNFNACITSYIYPLRHYKIHRKLTWSLRIHVIFPRITIDTGISRDDCSCGDREHNEGCASSKGGDRNSDNLSSTEGDKNLDVDEYRQYSRWIKFWLMINSLALFLFCSTVFSIVCNSCGIISFECASQTATDFYHICWSIASESLATQLPFQNVPCEFGLWGVIIWKWLDYDDCAGRCSGNRGVVAAVTRAQTTLSQSSNSGPTSQLPPRKSGRELFFTIKSAADDSDDFDPRATSKSSGTLGALPYLGTRAYLILPLMKLALKSCSDFFVMSTSCSRITLD